MVLEASLRSILRDEDRFPSRTVTFTEYGLGGDAGAPDCWVAGGGCWNPVELKLGKSVANQLRPSQYRWHKDSLLLGIPTYGAAINKNDRSVKIFRLILGPNNDVIDDIALEVSANELELWCFIQVFSSNRSI